MDKETTPLKTYPFLILFSLLLINSSLASDSGMVFNFSFQVDSTFSFNLDSLESDPWLSTQQIMNKSSQCYIDSPDIVVKQDFSYNFHVNSSELMLEILLSSNQYIYQVFNYSDQKNSSRRLKVYVLDLDSTSYLIKGIKLLWENDFQLQERVIYCEKQGNYFVLGTNSNLFVFLENIGDVSYSLNLTGSFALLHDATVNPKNMMSFFLNENVFAVMLALNSSNYMLVPSRNTFSEAVQEGEVVLTVQNMLVSCMGFVFFSDGKSIFINEIDSYSDVDSLPLRKTMSSPLDNLVGMQRMQRSLLFYNKTHVYEHVLVNDCFDIKPFSLYSIRAIYTSAQMPYDSQVIVNIVANNEMFLVQTNTYDLFAKIIQTPKSAFFFFTLHHYIPTITTLEFLLYHTKDFPMISFLNINNNSFTLSLRTFQKQQETLNCEVPQEGISLKVETSHRFCNQLMFNYTQQENNIDWNPNENCTQFSNFFITRLNMGISIVVIISVSVTIFFLCLLISAIYLIRKYYLKKKRKSAYLAEAFDENEDAEFENKIPDLMFIPENSGSESMRFPHNSHRGLIIKNAEIDLEQKKVLNFKKKEIEMSRISLKIEDVSFTTPQKSEENRLQRDPEDIAEESKSQEANKGQIQGGFSLNN